MRSSTPKRSERVKATGSGFPAARGVSSKVGISLPKQPAQGSKLVRGAPQEPAQSVNSAIQAPSPRHAADHGLLVNDPPRP